MGNCCLINLDDMLQNGTVINGVMAGAVRLSLGYMTTYQDCDRVVEFIQSTYVQYFVY